MPATQGKEKLNPGDLVTLDPNVYLTDTVEYYGLGLYLEFKNGYHWVYWFKLTRRWSADQLRRPGGDVAPGYLIKVS